jgi:hypothetical protein
MASLGHCFHRSRVIIRGRKTGGDLIIWASARSPQLQRLRLPRLIDQLGGFAFLASVASVARKSGRI